MGRTVTFGIVVVAVLVVVGIGGFLFLGQAPRPEPESKATAEQQTAEKESAAPEDSGGISSEEGATAKSSLIKGTPDDDILTGTSENDRIYAAEDGNPMGSDTIDGGGGDDRIYADASDRIQGGAGHDELIVRDPNGFSLMLAGTGIEETWGGNGVDSFDGTGVPDKLILRGGRGPDRLTGGSGDDLLYGGEGEDVLQGGPGKDTLKGEAGTDTLTGGPGADEFVYTKYDGSTDTITDYNFEEGDTVTAASFVMRGNDTALLDASGQTLFLVKDYDATVKGVGRPK